MYLRSAWTKRGQALADDWNDVTEGDDDALHARHIGTAQADEPAARVLNAVGPPTTPALSHTDDRKGPGGRLDGSDLYGRRRRSQQLRDTKG